MKKITIAIDGYSSCGKSTMAKDLAKEIGYVYVDTGAMYRSVTLYALRHQLFEADGAVKTEELQKEMKNISISFKFNATTGRPDCYLNGELVEKEIRSLEVSDCRRSFRQRGAGRAAAEDGRRQGYRDGWSRYRYHRVP